MAFFTEGMNVLELMDHLLLNLINPNPNNNNNINNNNNNNHEEEEEEEDLWIRPNSIPELVVGYYNIAVNPLFEKKRIDPIEMRPWKMNLLGVHDDFMFVGK